MADSQYNEVERRVRTVEEELNGEKHLTRYAVEQTTRNGEVLHALRSDVSAVILRVDHLAADMAAVKAALAMHGRALDVLQQDVRQLRSQMTEIRIEVNEMRTQMIEMHAQMTGTRIQMTEMHAQMTGMRIEMTEMHAQMTGTRTQMAEIDAQMSGMRIEMSGMRQESGTRHAELIAAIATLAVGAAPPA